MKVEQRQMIERAIAREAIRGLLADGFKVSVFDGEETVLKDSIDPAAIEAAMFSTDEDQFHVQRGAGAGTEKGWVLFIYGNDGHDVIADNTVNIEPGMKIRNGEGYATVSGFQKCMRADGIELLENDCIVVGKDTQTVQVQVHTREGNTYENSVETWTVVRTPEHPDRTTLKRPSGEYVMGAGHGNVIPTKKDSGQ